MVIHDPPVFVRHSCRSNASHSEGCEAKLSLTCVQPMTLHFAALLLPIGICGFIAQALLYVAFRSSEEESLVTFLLILDIL